MNRTENHILFDCQEEILKQVWTIETCNKISSFIDDYYVNKGKEINNNFSHDNWKGVICWIKVFGFEWTQLRIPVLGRHSLRPDNFALFLYVRNRLIGTLFIWIYLLFQVIDAIRMRKDHEGVPHTSGLLLNYFVMKSFKFNWTFKFIDWRVRNTFEKGWLGVFERYYVEPHNIRVLEAFKKYEISNNNRT